jgi:transcription antitermination factor NusG
MHSFSALPELFLNSLPSRWYAAHTYPRHEKKIAEHLTHRALDFFLPLYSSVRRWNDRTSEVRLPLFPGYIFVHIPISRRFEVLGVPGVVHLVSFRQQPLPIPDEEIQLLRESIAHRKAEPWPYLSVDSTVRITKGPLQGLEGIVQRRKNRTRIIVCVDALARSISVELEACDLECLTKAAWKR